MHEKKKIQSVDMAALENIECIAQDGTRAEKVGMMKMETRNARGSRNKTDMKIEWNKKKQKKNSENSPKLRKGLVLESEKLSEICGRANEY